MFFQGRNHNSLWLQQPLLSPSPDLIILTYQGRNIEGKELLEALNKSNFIKKNKEVPCSGSLHKIFDRSTNLFFWMSMPIAVSDCCAIALFFNPLPKRFGLLWLELRRFSNPASFMANVSFEYLSFLTIYFLLTNSLRLILKNADSLSSSSISFRVVWVSMS